MKRLTDSPIDSTMLTCFLFIDRALQSRVQALDLRRQARDSAEVSS
jgi:hypothetical protein